MLTHLQSFAHNVSVSLDHLTFAVNPSWLHAIISLLKDLLLCIQAAVVLYFVHQWWTRREEFPLVFSQSATPARSTQAAVEPGLTDQTTPSGSPNVSVPPSPTRSEFEFETSKIRPELFPPSQLLNHVQRSWSEGAHNKISKRRKVLSSLRDDLLTFVQKPLSKRKNRKGTPTTTSSPLVGGADNEGFSPVLPRVSRSYRLSNPTDVSLA